MVVRCFYDHIDSTLPEAYAVELMNSCMTMLLQRLGICRREFIVYVLYGRDPSGQQLSITWMQPTAAHSSLHAWLKRFACINNMRQKGAIFGGNCLLLCYVILVKLLFPWIPNTLFRSLVQTFPICDSSRQLMGHFSKITKKINFNLFGKTVIHPLIVVTNKDASQLNILKKKNMTQDVLPNICVPAPSHRLPVTAQFISLDKNTVVSKHDEALLRALRAECPTVPCGNPLDQMLFELLFKKAISDPCVLLPVQRDGRAPLLPDLVSRVLAYNILNCRIKLPLLHRQCTERAKAKLSMMIPEAVLCMECGHCLNFGRGKFKRVTFSPNHVFYCRDHKEKQLVICGTTGRIFCSYCGSQSIVTCKLIDVDHRGNHIIRAIISNNAAVMLRSSTQELDFILPCLGHLNCGEAIIKRVAVGRLLYLSSSPSNLLCLKCQSKHEYT